MSIFLLDYTLKVRLSLIIFTVIAVFAITYSVSYAERNGIVYEPEQQIKYSHKLHAGEMKIDCKYCHTGVEVSRAANIASVPSRRLGMSIFEIIFIISISAGAPISVYK